MIRIHVPKKPFSEAQMKSVFELFIRQLHGIFDTNSDVYEQSYYILERLACVNAFVLLVELERGSQDMLIDLFQTLFDSVK